MRRKKVMALMEMSKCFRNGEKMIKYSSKLFGKI